MITLLVLGCSEPDPAPDDLDGLFTYFWQGWEEGTDEELAEGITNLLPLADQLAVGDDAELGSMSRLTVEDVSLTDVDPANASGIYMLNVFSCTPDQLETVLTYRGQEELYGVYEAYERVYTSELGEFTDGATDMLTWDTSYIASMVGLTYEARLEEGIRRLTATEATDFAYAPAYFYHRVMPEPVDPGDDDISFTQDYKIEVYVERASGEIVHMHGMWREADFGTGLTSEDEFVQNLVLNGMEDWDDDTMTWCREGVPGPR